MPGYLDENGNPAQGNPQNALTGPQGGRQGYTGDDVRTRINALYQQYYGRDATAREIAGYGNDVDDRYLRAIEENLQRSEEGQAYHRTTNRNRINGVYQELLGRDATADELSGYGDNVDDRYLDAIRRNIANTDEARQYEQNPHRNTPAPSTPNTGTGGSAPDMNAIRAKLASGNHDTIVEGLHDLANANRSHPADSSYETWANYILNGNGESRDSNYFIDRVMNNDPEFAGKPTGPSYLDPWGGQYKPPDYQAPPPFEAPDPSKVLDDPAIQMQMQESLKALQRSALGRGTLLTGGTAVDMNNMAQQIASAGYDKLYQRAAAEDQVKYGRSLDEYGIARDNALATYNDQKGTFYDNEDRPFSKLMSVAGMGQNALNASNGYNANYLGQYGNALNNGTGSANGYYTGAANATGAGRVGASNAWGQALGNSANSLGYLYSQYMNQNRLPGSFNQPNAGNSY